MTTKISNKGRITRVDQAWDAAHREAFDHTRVPNIDEAHEQAIAEHERRFPVATNVVPFEHAGRVEIDQPQTAMPGIIVPLKVVQAALLCAARDDIRFYLNGVYVHAVEGDMRIVSTDGHRLVVTRFAVESVPAWADEGVIIPRDELAQIMPMLNRNVLPYSNSDGFMLLDYAGGDTLRVHCANGFASFTMKRKDGKFPDYARVLSQIGMGLARGEGEAMQAAAIKTEYLRGAADVAARLGATAVHSFISDKDDQATFFTFAGAPDSAMVVMPCRVDGQAVSDGVVRILGSGGVAGSIAAFRAHITRTQKLIGSSVGKEREQLEARKHELEAKVSRLLSLTGPAQLEHKAA